MFRTSQKCPRDLSLETAPKPQNATLRQEGEREPVVRPRGGTTLAPNASVFGCQTSGLLAREDGCPQHKNATKIDQYNNRVVFLFYVARDVPSTVS